MNPTRELLFGGSVPANRHAKSLAGQIRLLFGLVALITVIGSLTGCVGYADGGYGGYGDYGSYDEGPDLYLFGGDYGRGRDEQAYSHRGSMSRASVHADGGGHSGGGRGGGHGGGRR